MAASRSKDPTRMACRATIPPREMTAVSVVPPPMSTIMLPLGSWIGSPAPMAAAMGCSMSWDSVAPAWRAASRGVAGSAVAPAPGLGGEGLELLGEALHVGLHGAGLAMPQPQDETADQADDHRQPEIRQVRHGPDRTSAMGWAQLDQSTPP